MSQVARKQLLPLYRNISPISTFCGLSRAHVSLFSNRFFYWFFRTETFRPEPVFFQLSSYNVLFTAAEAAQNHHLNFTAPEKGLPPYW